MSGYIRIHPDDNVAVALEKLNKGQEILGVTLREDIPAGHKFALEDIGQGRNIVKYAFPIGHATCDIPASHAELHATLLQCAGLPVPEGQTSIFDLDPDADYQRRYLYYPTSHDNGGYLPDLKEYMVGPGLDAQETGRLLTRKGVVETGE